MFGLGTMCRPLQVRCLQARSLPNEWDIHFKGFTMTRLHTLGTTLALIASTLSFAQPAGAQQGSAATAPSAAASTTGSAASSGKAGGLNSADNKFLLDAAKGGMKEVSLSQMAQQKGSTDAVKQYAARMIEDHTKANDELKQLASSKGVTLPTASPDEAKAKKMQSMSGAAFDKGYMAEMLADHKKTVALFEKQSRSTGGDADIKAFAVKTLPALKDHLQMVQSGKLASASMGTGMVMKN